VNRSPTSPVSYSTFVLTQRQGTLYGCWNKESPFAQERATTEARGHVGLDLRFLAQGMRGVGRTVRRGSSSYPGSTLTMVHRL
jgi:hypothetical protein